MVLVRWTPHPVIVTIRDNGNLLGCSYSPIVPLLQGGGPSHIADPYKRFLISEQQSRLPPL